MSTVTAEQFLLVGGIILLALILLGIGVIGALRSRNPDPAVHKAVTSDKPAPEWLKGLADTASKTITRAPGSANLPADALVVMRDAASGGWMIEINSVRYTNLKDIHDDRTASKVLEALAGLQELAGLKRPAAMPSAPPALARSDIPPAGQSKPNVEPAVAAALQAGNSSSPVHPAPPNSMLDQIEKILQRNLMRQPELSRRKIHVGAARDGSLLIEVDQQFYQAVGDVPEPAVRNIIQVSIQEWERSA